MELEDVAKQMEQWSKERKNGIAFGFIAELHNGDATTCEFAYGKGNIIGLVFAKMLASNEAALRLTKASVAMAEHMRKEPQNEKELGDMKINMN